MQLHLGITHPCHTPVILKHVIGQRYPCKIPKARSSASKRTAWTRLLYLEIVEEVGPGQTAPGALPTELEAEHEAVRFYDEGGSTKQVIPVFVFDMAGPVVICLEPLHSRS